MERPTPKEFLALLLLEAICLSSWVLFVIALAVALTGLES